MFQCNTLSACLRVVMFIWSVVIKETRCVQIYLWLFLMAPFIGYIAPLIDDIHHSILEGVFKAA